MLKLYNTLTHQIEDFKPLDPDSVRMYSCGPTVYDFAHIGHMRTYVGNDILVRTLRENDYNVKWVMNITDVGHLASDADTGEDKMEKGAKKYGMSVWDIAKKFEDQFWYSISKLNIQKPDIVMHATDYIEDQIELVKALEKKGYTYRTHDGIYFDTSKFKGYSNLSGQSPEELKAGARVEMVKGKRNPTDFALWKFSPNPAMAGEKRQMEWDSPWGKGFPGWHLECSTMAMVALGPTLDIHTGGIDHIAVHHTNEIAQSEAATGRKFVNYWIHFGFLLVESEKMSKSIGNIYTMEDIMNKGFNPLALRYLFLQTHYSHEMNFKWESLKAAQQALENLYETAASFPEPNGIGVPKFENKFFNAITNNLDTPNALSFMWQMLRAKENPAAKAHTLYKMDEILGLKIKEYVETGRNISDEIRTLVKDREKLRKAKRYHLADEIRHKIEKRGYTIKDTKKGTIVIKKT